MSNDAQQTQDPSVLVIGEALIDLVVQFGDDVDNAEAVPGGSPANVALALGRLDVPVELVAWFGQDDYGKSIRKHLTMSNVHIGDASMEAEETPRAIAWLDEDNAATYSFILDWSPKDIEIPDSAVIVHTGSIGAVLQPGHGEVVKAIDSVKDRVLVSYDPNARPQIMSDKDHAKRAIEALASRADVIKSSDEDLLWLYPDSTPEESAKRWIDEFDIPFFVLTRGKQGPKGWIRGEISATVDPADVPVIDTVGAGDTFMGGLLDALMRRGIYGAGAAQKLSELTGEELQQILNEASELADIVVQRRGANPPWAHELSR